MDPVWIHVDVADSACVNAARGWDLYKTSEGNNVRVTNTNASMTLTVKALAVKVVGIFWDNTTTTARFSMRSGMVLQNSSFDINNGHANDTQTLFESGLLTQPPEYPLTLTVTHSTLDGGSLALSELRYVPLPGATDNGGCSIAGGGERSDGPDNMPWPGRQSSKSMSGAHIAAIVISSIVFFALISTALVWLHLRIVKKKQREWMQLDKDSFTGSKETEVMRLQEPSGPRWKVVPWLLRQNTTPQRPLTLTTQSAYFSTVFGPAIGATEPDPSDWSRSRHASVAPARHGGFTPRMEVPSVQPMPGANHEKALPSNPSRVSGTLGPRSPGLFTEAGGGTAAVPGKDNERQEPRSPKSAPAHYSWRQSTRSLAASGIAFRP